MKEHWWHTARVLTTLAALLLVAGGVGNFTLSRCMLDAPLLGALLSRLSLFGAMIPSEAFVPIRVSEERRLAETLPWIDRALASTRMRRALGVTAALAAVLLGVLMVIGLTPTDPTPFAGFWALSTLILLLGKFELRRPRLSAILPELIAAVCALQALDWSLHGLSRRMHRTLTFLHVDVVVVDRVALALTALAIPTLWVIWRREGRSDRETHVAATLASVVQSIAFGIVVCRPAAPAARSTLAALLSAVSVWVSLELAASAARRRNSAELHPPRIAMLDGHPVLSPFVIANEARVRVLVAHIFGFVALTYHASIIGAVIASWAGSAAVFANRAAKFAILTLPFLWVATCSPPPGPPFARYTRRDGLVRDPNFRGGQDCDDLAPNG